MTTEMMYRTPLSYLFFLATGIAMYYSSELPALTWIAYAGFANFLGFGPVRWIEGSLMGLRKILPDEDGEHQILAKTIVNLAFWNKISWLAGVLETAAYVSGLGCRAGSSLLERFRGGHGV